MRASMGGALNVALCPSVCLVTSIYSKVESRRKFNFLLRVTRRTLLRSKVKVMGSEKVKIVVISKNLSPKRPYTSIHFLEVSLFDV